MKDIKKFSGMSEKSPAMKTPLVNHLKFDGMTKYGNYILLGTAEEIPNLEPYTKNTYIIWPPLLYPYHTKPKPSP